MAENEPQPKPEPNRAPLTRAELTPEQNREVFRKEVQERANREFSTSGELIERIDAVRNKVDELADAVRDKKPEIRAEAAQLAAKALGNYMQMIRGTDFDARVKTTVDRLGIITKIPDLRGRPPADPDKQARLNALVNELNGGAADLGKLSQEIDMLKAAARSESARAEGGSLVASIFGKLSGRERDRVIAPQ